MDLTDRISSYSRIYILLKCVWNVPQDTSHIRYKTCLNKFKKIEIISSIVSHDNGMKLKSTTERKQENAQTGTKHTGTTIGWRRTSKGNFKNNLRQQKENATYQNLWDEAKTILKGKFIPISDYILKTRKISNYLYNWRN